MRSADGRRVRRRNVSRRHVRHEHELVLSGYSGDEREKNLQPLRLISGSSMGRLAEVAEKIEQLETELSQAKASLADRDAQLALATTRLAEIRRQTAEECVAEIYPDGNPEIAIRRIKGIFGLG